MQTEEKATLDTPFEQIGGEAGIQKLVDRFYELMELEPAYARLRATHGSSLDNARQRLFWFLCGWLGGPQHYVERFGHPALRARHMPERIGGHTIGLVERDQWVACMAQAMDEVGVDPVLREELHKNFFRTADWMRNRAG